MADRDENNENMVIVDDDGEFDDDEDGEETSTAPNVSVAVRIQEFPQECFKDTAIRKGAFFCEACREEISVKRSTIINHINTHKHLSGKEKLHQKAKRERDLAEVLRAYDEENHPIGETLSMNTRVFRLKVVTAFMKAGIAINKINCFRSILEESAYKLTDRTNMAQLIPVVHQEEKKNTLEELTGREISIVFDGTTRLGEALVIIVRFLDSEWKIQQRLLRFLLLAKSLAGEEVAREIISVLAREASVNNVAVRTIKVIFPNILDIGCFSHTLDHVGEKFDTPVLTKFIKHWVSLFAHSPHAKLLWKDRTGKSLTTYSPTRWWSQWECIKQDLFLFYPHVTAFLTANRDTGTAPATTRKLLDIIANSEAKLKIEIAATVDAGEPFVKKTYSLEGDGPLVLEAHDAIIELENCVRLMHMPNVTQISSELAATDGPDQRDQEQWQDYACQCVQPGFNYFLDTFANADNLSQPLSCFKAARLVDPRRVNDLVPTVADVKELGNFPFISNTDLDGLVAELPAYLAASTGVHNDDILAWWKRHEDVLPRWSREARKIFLCQPSSAAAERAFSLLKASFNEQQDSALEDYIETSLMLQYNGRGLGR
ncbi:RNA-directed DNA polymerase from transposon BS [Paramuricea clavata]|uniref:RNA-directed DNA polymerase from transposon BS n=2 Tax=Paramuricea clavata TaxID=317549 RepID=A0A7D9K3D1_PARCT|nr:RNA-directed DNA polymerase from transposon BS [Paramuricea clavata]